MPKKRSVIAMSSSYLLLKENKQEMNTSLNQTILKEDANTFSTHSILQTLESSLSIFLILTLIFLSINVFLKLIEKLFAYLGKKIHTYFSKTDTVCDASKENSSTQSSLESSKDSK